MRRSWCALALLLSLSACSDPEPGKVVVLGFDGMDPAAVDLLMSEGKLPHFARLRQEGAYGRLRATPPLLSPVLWTTIATGKTPADHRIGHFVLETPDGRQLPVTSQMRKSRALWNIVSAAKRSVAVVGWWATWPAETVEGAIVSDRVCYHFLLENPSVRSQERMTHPPELLAEVLPLVRKPESIGPADVAPFIHVPDAELAAAGTFEDPVPHFKWVLATTESYRRIGLHLLEERSPDLALVYFEGTDSTSHLFGHLFRRTGLAGELLEQQRRFGTAVEAMYARADAILGEYMEAVGRNTTLVVLSDHGFALGELPDDPSKTRDMRRVSEAFHRPDGILYLWGRDVVGRARISGATMLDVAPTVLALLSLPAGTDMPGRVLDEALRTPPPPRIATHEPAVAIPVAPEAGVADAEMLERLRALGYLEGKSPKGDRNLAGVLFEQGRFDEAAAAYEALVADSPEDGALRASYAGALAAAGCHPEALEQIDRALALDPLNAEAYHNRAAIYERRGMVPEAIAQYRTALRYSPRYEPSQSALRRLEAPSREAPEAPRRARATDLAQQASDAARRGDYPAALRLLEEAERLAPRLALIQQYRSNVAYLMGDREGAMVALRKGLAMEPDNALFRENLRRLEAEPAPR